MSKPEPCPRCHSAHVVVHSLGMVAQVICKGDGCGLNLIRASEAEALEAWNWRPAAGYVPAPVVPLRPVKTRGGRATK